MFYFYLSIKHVCILIFFKSITLNNRILLQPFASLVPLPFPKPYCLSSSIRSVFPLILFLHYSCYYFHFLGIRFFLQSSYHLVLLFFDKAVIIVLWQSSGHLPVLQIFFKFSPPIASSLKPLVTQLVTGQSCM